MTSGPTKAGRKAWIGLGVLALPTLLVSIDLFVMLLALPKLSAALHASNIQQLWTLDMYGFMVAGFLVTMGTLGDRIGRRKLLLIGAAAFGIASLMAAFATSPAMLIGARALLGVAGATLTPSTLALISSLFPNAKQRATAIGIWAGCFTVGAIIGPLVGGVMLEHFWWGSVFLLGVPAMVLLLILGPIFLPEYRNPKASRLDLTSVSLSLLAILPTIYGLKELARHGWEVVPSLALAIGLIVGVLFIRRERRLTDPLLDVRLFASGSFSTMLGSMLLYSMLGGTTMAFIAQHFQLVEQLSPLHAGLAMVPGMIAATIGFQLAAILARRIRPAYVIAAGLCITVAGFLLIASTSTTWALIIGFALSSFGGAPLVALGVNLIVGSVPPEKAGSAAAMAQTSNEFGIALGIATLGSLAAFIYRHQLSGHLPSGISPSIALATHESLAGATVAAGQLPHQLNTALLSPAREAFTSGLHVIAAISALSLAVIATLILQMLRRVPPLGQSDTTTDAEKEIT